MTASTQAFVFPGQGSQAVGMGKDLAETFACAREVFEEVDDALGQSLSRIMFEGPGEDLTATENTQPALMAVSMAVMRVLTRQGGLSLPGTAAYVAGHSLGEYSALAAADALPLADAARLLKRRGQAMQKAVPAGKGAMIAILGLDLEAVQALAEQAAPDDTVCDIANDNAPGQVVLSGDAAAIARAADLAKEAGARMVRQLAVSAPFHCRLLAPAAEAMAEALAEQTFDVPAVPLIANISATPIDDPALIPAALVEQVTAMVRWRESVLYMKEHGVETLVELGAGTVLGKMAQRIDRSLKGTSLRGPADIEKFLKTL